MNKLPKRKVFFLFLIIVIYILFGITVKLFVIAGKIPKAPPELNIKTNLSELKDIELNLEIARNFVNENFVNEDGHVNLIYKKDSLPEHNYTNSEALSYYMYWNLLESDRKNFDRSFNFIKEKMLHPKYHYLMWKLDFNDEVIDDGGNIASDADLRALKSLILAEEKWRDDKYGKIANDLAEGLENTVITKDSFFAPYAVLTENGIEKTNEVWLSYSDFNAFRLFEKRRGEPWRKVYGNMKAAILQAQLPNGLYNTQLSEERKYHNELDGGDYSINSLWVMVRAAESKDSELRKSAQKSLNFYKVKFKEDGIIYTSYDENGNPSSSFDSPWVYALIARAAIELGDEIAEEMIAKLLDFQDINEESKFYGSFIEGSENDIFVSQFTMQESIITLQRYVGYG